ncbi:selenium metabolism-associated LysR family transcriptional regulator [Citroniella saccharovorans]|uniref:Selenium metabolism-associated LysR family transcriptional regulator n=1 Tax=Citroniella saccharovorans TaxID=2053367 RepID=A0AAW9MUK0_9FIRM|nr:selenium metabolism-associated LysR family transcriptional regulator [Citroniella saccharovorans]MEB3429685.1 selenium metabolism-associated LysR family transcriptional regulator [Citroniella saccharovorans]
MDFRQIETFLYVSKTKNFTKAAEELYITQPTVSNHIATLEKELDTALFIRSRKNVSLTKSGEIFLKYALDLFSIYKNMTSDIKNFNQNFNGLINIYASSIPRKYFLPRILSEFSYNFSDVKYSLLEDNSSSVIESIITGQTDFGFVGKKIEDNRLVYKKIMEDELVVVDSKIKPNINICSDIINLDTLLSNKLLLRPEGSGTRDLFESRLKNKNIELDLEKVLMVIEDPASIIEMVIEGIGTTVISIWETKKIESLGLVNIYRIPELNLKRDFYFVYNNDFDYIPLNNLFKKFVLSKINV